MEANNWLALLKWSLSQSNDGTNISEYSEMSEENKKWLDIESLSLDIIYSFYNL